MLTSEILKKARKCIAQYGWRRGEYGNREEGFCMLGALAEVSECGYLEAMCGPAYAALSRYLEITTKRVGFTGIAYYNDNLAQSETDVMEAFNGAAAMARLRERQ